jgi:hypothetical protein
MLWGVDLRHVVDCGRSTTDAQGQIAADVGQSGAVELFSWRVFVGRDLGADRRNVSQDQCNAGNAGRRIPPFSDKLPNVLTQVRQFWPTNDFSRSVLVQNGVASRV